MADFAKTLEGLRSILSERRFWLSSDEIVALANAIERLTPKPMTHAKAVEVLFRHQLGDRTRVLTSSELKAVAEKLEREQEAARA